METTQVAQPQAKPDIDEKTNIELRKLLEKKGAIIERGSSSFVIVEKINREYIPEKLWGAKEIPYEEVLKGYKEHKLNYMKITPKKYVDEFLTGKRYLRADYVGQSAGLIVPIYTEGVNVSGEPRVETSGRYVIVDEASKVNVAGVSAGVSLNSKSEFEQFAQVNYGGIFGRLTDGVKKFTAGVQEGIFTVSTELIEGANYLVGVGIGPYAASINVVTGKVTGIFSWIFAAFEVVQGMFSRAFEEKIALKNGSFDEKTALKNNEGIIGKVAENAIIAGTSETLVGKRRENNSIKVMVTKVEKMKPESNEATFLGKEIRKEGPIGAQREVEGPERRYIARYEYETLNIYEHNSVLAMVGKAFKPIEILKDLWNSLVINPWRKLVDFVDGFGTPPKLLPFSNDSAIERGLEEKMHDALKRGNYNTARKAAIQLEGASNALTRAEYAYYRDTIEWGMAHRGFPYGYISGLGFGNKKDMVNKRLRERIDDAITVRTKGDLEAEGIKLNHPKERLDSIAADDYLRSKANFRANSIGRRVPRAPVPEDYIEKVFTTVATMGERPVFKSIITGGGQQTEASNKLDFRKIKPNLPEAEEFPKVMVFLQAVYEKVPELKREVTREYGFLNYAMNEYALDKQASINMLSSLIKGFRKNMVENGLAQEWMNALKNPYELPPEKLKEIYLIAIGRTKREGAPRQTASFSEIKINGQRKIEFSKLMRFLQHAYEKAPAKERKDELLMKYIQLKAEPEAGRQQFIKDVTANVKKNKIMTKWMNALANPSKLEDKQMLELYEIATGKRTASAEQVQKKAIPRPH